MKKLIFILLIAVCAFAKAQTTGIVISGKTLFNSQDSIYYSTVYSIPPYEYYGWNGVVDIKIPLCRSAYAAKTNQVLNFVNIPVLDTVYVSVGYPTATTLYNVAKKYLNNQGFTVTTF